MIMNSSNRIIHNYYSPFDDDVEYRIKIKMNVDSSEYTGVFSYENGRIQVEFDGLIKYDYFSSNEQIQCHANGTEINLVRILTLWSNEPLKKTFAIFEYALLQNSSGYNSENLFVKSSLQFDNPLEIFGHLSHHIRHTKQGNLLVENELKTINSEFGEDTLSIINNFEYRSDDHLITVKHAHVFSIDFSEKKNLKEIVTTVEELTHLINLLTYTKNNPLHISL